MFLSLYTALQTRFAELRDREEGATAVEYGLIIALVAILAIAGLILFGGTIGSFLSNMTGSV